MQDSGGLHIGLELTAFRAFRIAIECKSGGTGRFQKNHADIRQTCGIDGRERHRIRVVELALFRLVEPAVEHGKGLDGFGEVTCLLTFSMLPLVGTRSG